MPTSSAGPTSWRCGISGSSASSAEIASPCCCRGSPEVYVALLGILKAGAAYVSLDPDYPAERVGFILSPTAPPVNGDGQGSRCQSS